MTEKLPCRKAALPDNAAAGRPFSTGETATGAIAGVWVCDGVSEVHGEGTKSLTRKREHWPAGADVVVGEEASRVNSERRKRWNWAAAFVGGLGGLVCVVGVLEGDDDGGREVSIGEAVGGLAMVVVDLMFWW